MKRFLIISGCFFLLIGLFYESLPLELTSGLWSMFSSGSREIHFRVVRGEQLDYTQFGLLGFGALLVLLGLLRRASKTSDSK